MVEWMKRASVGLVEYSSSEEETLANVNEQPAQKRRKLPPLSSSLTVPAPVDNPALHQGRVRTVPHIEGQYATYIYVPLLLHHNDPLFKLIDDALTFSKAHVPSLHAIGKLEQDDHKAAQLELHISLSRPLFLRAHQREELRRAIRQTASSMTPFDASFTTFSELTNDERTRTFLALEVGAGYRELRRCLDLLGPTLRSLRQKEFYVDPKFHSSIAWALLDKTPSRADPASISVTGELDEIAPPECSAPEEPHARSASLGTIEQSNSFHRIPHFPPSLVPSLNGAYATKLSQARTGSFAIDRMSAKIGKDVFTWPMNAVK